MNSDRYCSLNNALTKSFSLLFAFSGKEIHPELYSSMGTPTMALGMMETPTYPMKTHMLLQDVGRTTSTMNSLMSPVNYGKITISQETLAGFQSLPLSHILKPSLLKGLIMLILVYFLVYTCNAIVMAFTTVTFYLCFRPQTASVDPLSFCNL